MNSGMVSVIVPCFNAQDWIVETLNSAINQTYRNVEFLVIDDGSVDRSASIVNEHFGSKVTLISQDGGQNKGQASAINLGLSNATGEYIAFLDSDDLWEKCKLERQVDHLNCHKDIALVYTGGYAIDSIGSRQYDLFEKEHLELNNPNNLLLNCYIRTPSTVMIRSDVSRTIGMFDTSLQSCDHDYWLRVAERFKISYLPDPLTSYRRHTKQQSNNRRQWEDGLEILKKATHRYPYTDKSRRKRLAVIYYRLGVHDLAVRKKRLLGLKNLLSAFFFDPTRSIQIILRLWIRKATKR